MTLKRGLGSIPSIRIKPQRGKKKYKSIQRKKTSGWWEPGQWGGPEVEKKWFSTLLKGEGTKNLFFGSPGGCTQQEELKQVVEGNMRGAWKFHLITTENSRKRVIFFLVMRVDASGRKKEN